MMSKSVVQRGDLQTNKDICSINPIICSNRNFYVRPSDGNTLSIQKPNANLTDLKPTCNHAHHLAPFLFSQAFSSSPPSPPSKLQPLRHQIPFLPAKPLTQPSLNPHSSLFHSAPQRTTRTIAFNHIHTLIPAHLSFPPPSTYLSA